MFSDDTCCLLRRVLAAQRFDEITVGIYQYQSAI